MSEMFTKIGGYIASGDPLVYSDSATMTGNGTVASPFGVNKTDMFVQSPLFTGTSGEGSATSAYIGFSGYNETVLWETDQWATNYPTALTLSEDPQNFKEIRVLYGCYGSPDGGNNILKSISFMPNANRNGVIVLDGVMRGAPGLYYNVIDEWSGVNTTAWSWVNGKLSDFASTSQQPNNNKWCSPYKIIGINRKPEA